jgi:hypothetical protein
MKCVLCSKPLTHAAVLIAGMPVGPVCARKSNLMPLAARKTGAVRPGPAYKRHATRQEVDQLDLFEGVA